jgi:hypothetical protein
MKGGERVKKFKLALIFWNGLVVGLCLVGHGTAKVALPTLIIDLLTVAGPLDEALERVNAWVLAWCKARIQNSK